MSSEGSGSGWRSTVLKAAAVVIPTALAGSVAWFYYNFKKDQRDIQERQAAKAAKPVSEFMDDEQLMEAIAKDIANRDGQKPLPKLEARIFKSIRRLTPENCRREYKLSTRIDIGQWIIMYWSLQPGSGLVGAASTLSKKQERDYDVAWLCLESAVQELGAKPAPSAEEQETLTNTEVVLLDLAHKRRDAEKMNEYYSKIREKSEETRRTSAKHLGEEIADR
jgi:hypothetical protein